MSVISLPSGIFGEKSASHQKKILESKLKELGLATYYGPALFPDIADPGNEILPYTKQWLLELITPLD